MKRDNNNNNSNRDNGGFKVKDGVQKVKDSVKDIPTFYNNNKSLINGIGIAALAGVAIYSIIKWLPYEEIVSKIEEKFDEKFADKEFSSSEKEYAQ